MFVLKVTKNGRIGVMTPISSPDDFLWKAGTPVSDYKTRLMDALTTADGNNLHGKRSRPGVRRPLKQQLRIDMTPMVDLGFLLISFFVITTELSKPTAMDLVMPKDGKPMPLGDSNAFTLLLDEHNQAWYYTGEWKKAHEEGAIRPVRISGKQGLRDQIIRRQQWLDARHTGEGREGLMLLIKAGPGTSYKNLVDVLDEMNINQVKKYAVVKMTPEEMAWIKKQPAE